jgi:hypothetical protein
VAADNQSPTGNTLRLHDDLNHLPQLFQGTRLLFCLHEQVSYRRNVVFQVHRWKKRKTVLLFDMDVHISEK